MSSAVAVDVADVKRWPTEPPLLAISVLAAILIWLLMLVSVIGIVYAAILGLVFFVAHVGFVAHIRGSAIKLGTDQFPELHAAVERLARRVGLEDVPDTYLMQAGGTLNAFATKFLGVHLVVLYADLLDACGDNTAARDMIIAHELGHVRAGHLRWQWFLLPAFFVPFLGTALSRAREYTCDRFGLAGAADRNGALLGLTILAAGARRGPLVDHRAMVQQAEDLNTGWMTIGEWLSTHPPLLRRIAALDPSLAPDGLPVATGRLRAGLIAGVFVLPVAAGGWVAAKQWPQFMERVRAEAQRQQAGTPAPSDTVTADPTQVVWSDFQRISAFLTLEVESGETLPRDRDDLYARWERYHPGEEGPRDPFDGGQYGYQADAAGAMLISRGPDRRMGTADDIVVRHRVGAGPGP